MIARLTFAATVSGLALLVAVPAFAANSPNRSQVVSMCVQKAQKQAPMRGDDTSVQQRRMALYSTCMRSQGMRP